MNSKIHIYSLFFFNGKIFNERWIIKDIQRKDYKIIKEYYNEYIFKFENNIVFSSDINLIQSYQIFFDKEGNRKIPNEILNESIININIFLNEKNDINIQGKIGSMGIYYLFSRIFNEVFIYERENNIFNVCIEKKENFITKVKELPIQDNYVYDVETDEGKYNCGVGTIIVSNTDSIYTSFPHINSYQELWDYSKKVSSEVSQLFKKPMSLDFENNIYKTYLIFLKKKYAYICCDNNGKIISKLKHKGILLSRRDNSEFTREIYNKIITMIFEGNTVDEIIIVLLEYLNNLFSNTISIKKFIISKVAGDSSFSINQEITETGHMKLGDYKTKALPTDEEERSKKFKKKGVKNEIEYYNSCLPPTVQLANKMKKRGLIVENGTRLEFVITGIEIHNNKISEKIEDVIYFTKNKYHKNIDFLYYTKTLVTSVEQIFKIISPEERYFIKNQYKWRENKFNMLQELKSKMGHKFIIEDNI